MFPTSSSADPVTLVRALLDWWRLAGVDHSFRPEPEAWLRSSSDAQAQSGGTETPEVARAGVPVTAQPTPAALSDEALSGLLGERASWPTDLEAFRSWWLTEPALAEPGAFPRVVPRGSQNVRLMVIVPEPEEQDRGELLSGPDGAMLDAFLRAAGIDAESCYIASALPRHTPLADWTAVAARGLGTVLAHHKKLVRPSRVVTFGRQLGPLVTELDALLAPGLDELRRSTKARQRFWRKWLNWTGDDPA